MSRGMRSIYDACDNLFFSKIVSRVKDTRAAPLFFYFAIRVHASTRSRPSTYEVNIVAVRAMSSVYYVLLIQRARPQMGGTSWKRVVHPVAGADTRHRCGLFFFFLSFTSPSRGSRMFLMSSYSSWKFHICARAAGKGAGDETRSVCSLAFGCVGKNKK